MPSDRVDVAKRATLRQFAALGAVSPLARFIDTRSDSDSDARGAIAGYLAATPGAHFSKIRDDLSLGTGETQHHLRRLGEAGAVESARDGDYRRFFPAGQFSSLEKNALGYLRRSTPRGMVLELLQSPDASGADLAVALEVSPSTISKYAGEMAAAGLLSREDGYALRNPETMLVLLVRYADSFDSATAAFASQAAEFIRVDR